MTQGLCFSVSPSILQQFMDKVLKNIQNKNIYKIIMDDTMIFLTHKQHSEDINNLFRTLTQFTLKISLHKSQYFRDYLTYRGLAFMLKDWKPMWEKWDTISKLKLPNSVKDHRSFCRMVHFPSSFFEKLRKHFIPILAFHANSLPRFDSWYGNPNVTKWLRQIKIEKQSS